VTSDLWTVLGYDEVARGIAHSLAASDDIGLIDGPPGIGKSGIAAGIAQLWEEGGGSTAIAEGDRFRSDVAFYPLASKMSGVQRWKSLAPAVATVARAGEVVVGTAGIITAGVEALAKARRGRRRGRAPLLEDAEQDVLVQLERLGKKQPLLLIADNLHWWDSRSLEFLARLREPRMREAFPFLNEMRMLAVETQEPYQTVANPRAHDALVGSSTTRRFKLQRVPRDLFGDVLVALGAPAKPPHGVAEHLWTLTGGHLALARRCAKRFATGEVEPFGARDSEEFNRKLLTDRIRALGTVGEEALALLQVAAVWGHTFSREEVACTVESDESETARLLRHCRDEEVVTLSNGEATFVHDIFRQYFLSLATYDRTSVYERMSECLARFRPAEYDFRCINALNAERLGEAAAFGVQAALQRQRDGRSWIELPRTILDAIERGGMTPVVVTATAALENLREYRFRACLNGLDTLPHDIPKRLLAEADWIRAMTLMSTRSERDRATARSILGPWMGYERHEPEVGTRLMQVLLYGLFHVRDKDQGLALESRMRQFLGERAGYDRSAEDALYTLDRCSGGLYPADISLIRIREAACYYGADEGETALRRPVEYYRCLVNLGATLVSNARHDEARDRHRDLERLVEGYADGVFPRLDLPRMNNLIAEYRSVAVTAAEAADRQRELAASPAVANDPFYAGNALAVYLALSGRGAEAIEQFDRLEAELTASRVTPEASMVYLIRANRCATRFCAGAVEPCQREWSELAEVVAQISYPSRDIHIRRHELFAAVIAEGVPMSPLHFDEALMVRTPAELGPLWEHYGRGFMLPAVEIWREN
jgi:hypothetical protein